MTVFELKDGTLQVYDSEIKAALYRKNHADEIKEETQTKTIWENVRKNG